ncbi:hypothetical protein B6U96_10395 [Archaeoglobales archaeon ex4484_92]|nr:MAG: hypothetical protein B6U96_10395 [Archaeoglobales archaeon ex4484_92]
MKRFFIFFIIAILLILVLVFPTETLEVSSHSFTCYTALNKTFSINYIHSVSRTKVIDTYLANSSGIYFIEERWQQFDAGQPISFDEIKEGFFIKRKIIKMGNSCEYWFIPINNASINFDGKILRLNSGNLRFQVKIVPWIITLIWRC